MDFRQAVGLTVLELRKRRGDSQQTFARKARLSRAALHNLETGQTGVTTDRLLDLAGMFNVSLLTFMAEVERRRTVFTERAFDFDSQILESGILVVTRVNLINNPAKEVQFFKHMYGYAKEHRLCRVLYNVKAAHIDVSPQQEWEIATAVTEWLREQGYWPNLAVVRNHTVGEHGPKVARREGLNVELFPDLDEALAWLEKEPLRENCC